jgi:leucyl-tRNA synthetase
LRLAYETVIQLLAPITPHISSELWNLLGYDGPIVNSRWPVCDERALAVDEVELAVQVTGKLRGKVVVAADASEDAIREVALADENVRKHLEGKTVVKVIVVPGRLVNIVAK